MIHIVEMREDEPHPSLVTADLANRFLHEPEVRRKALGTFSGNPVAVSLELVENDARHDQGDNTALHHFLDDTEYRHLSLVPRKIEPYACVNEHSEHKVHSKLTGIPVCMGWAWWAWTGLSITTCLLHFRRLIRVAQVTAYSSVASAAIRQGSVSRVVEGG